MAMTLQQVTELTTDQRFYRIHLTSGGAIIGIPMEPPADGLLILRKPKTKTDTTLLVVIDIAAITAIEMEE